MPADADLARQTRLRDRFYDLYVNVPMQKIVTDRLRPAGQNDPTASSRRRRCCRPPRHDRAGDGGEDLGHGRGFSMADCAAAPALFYADMVMPFGDAHKNAAAYLERLMERPSFARAVEEAQPYFALFPSRTAARSWSTSIANGSPHASDVAGAAAAVGARRASAQAPGSQLRRHGTTQRRRTQAMSSGGFSKARLARMHDVMAGHVERGRVPGLVTLVSRRGETHVDAIGMKAFGGSDPMRRDTIFRIASMTKPITAAAAMILVEEASCGSTIRSTAGCPSWRTARCCARIDSPLDDTVPANRPITLRDLLTFRLGPRRGDGVARASIRSRRRWQRGRRRARPERCRRFAPDELMKRFGSLPLLHQPGEKWLYHSGSDILGVLIARASGQTLETSCASASSRRSA